MSVAAFVNEYRGRFIQAPGGVGGQCVDLANQYLVEDYHLPIVHANAVNWATARIPNFTWVKNTPINYPKTGSLVVWGENAAAGTGPNGHIALVLTADDGHIISFDQNWEKKQYGELEIHVYDGVVGWQEPV